MTDKKKAKAAPRKEATKKATPKKPTAKKAAKKATRKKPATKKAAAKKATRKKPAAKKPAAKKPAAKKTARKKAVTKKGGGKKATRKIAGKAARGDGRYKRRKKRRDDEMIIVAVRGMVLFPGVVLPIAVGRPRSVRAIQAAVQSGRPVGVVLQSDSTQDDPTSEHLHDVGTAIQILRYVTAPDGTHHVVAQGAGRIRIEEYLSTEPFFTARVTPLPDTDLGALDIDDRRDMQARFLALKQQAHEALELLPQAPEDLDNAIENAPHPGILADLVATFMDMPVEEKQAVLETADLKERLAKVSTKLGELTQVLRMSSDIRDQTKGAMEKAQREYFLREQMRQIQEELGEGGGVEVAELETKIAEAGMTEEVEAAARKELKRLERMPDSSAEHSMIRTYLEWMTELPWSKSTEDTLDLVQAAAILDEDHHGLEKVKRRILEFLAVRKLKPDGKSPILCLTGPPGTGKTSLGRSVARAMGREFTRVSLGGVHDEAEIRGHRRTYVGAMPGNVIQGIRRAGVNNPVFLFDEMDKLGQGFHGDPAAALLEVLDPNQNTTFRDHYLDVPFDLSRVLFLATANYLENIPGPLRDRMEVIELSSYTEDEKLAIARQYLVPRQTEENGLTPEQLTITDAALVELVRHYTREAGCRTLERRVGAVARHVATLVAKGEAAQKTVDAADLHAILGPKRYDSEIALRTSEPGVATGLAWTPVGGVILFVEATKMPGKGNLTLTGQLGDVMQESAQAAMSLLRARAEGFGLDPKVFETTDLHVHLPEGATPKDGPSAGVTLYTTLVSLFTGRRVKSDVAMTGEINLRGFVLPVGGIKEKVLAAYGAGLRKVILPKRNEKDLEDIPEPVRSEITFYPVERVGEVLDLALCPAEAGEDCARESA